MNGPTRELAEFAIGQAFEELPAAVVDGSRTAILDVLGVGIAARDEALVGPLLQLVTPVAGGAPLLGRAERTSPLFAALVNGTLCHALDYDDTYQPVPIHPSASLVPALLGAAHGRRISGRDFLAAYAVGAETAIRIGLAAGRSHIHRGWHGTGTFGTFGAAAGAARLLGLSVDQVATSFGIAGVQAAGLLTAAAGTMCKPLHAGKAAMNGLLAAELAARRFTAPTAILEMPHGFTAAFSDGPLPDAYTSGLGKEYRLLDLSVKLYACCSLTHAVIDAGRALRRKGAVRITEIDRLVIEANAVATTVAGIQAPRRGLEGKFSLAYTAAASLAGRSMTGETFTDVAVGDPDLQALTRRAEVRSAPGYGDNEATVLVRLRDGKELSEHVAIARGNPGNPAAPEEIEEKFLSLTAPVLSRGRAERLRDAIRGLDALDDVGRLTEMVTA